MNLTIHDSIKSLIFRHGGNQDAIEEIRTNYKNYNCAGFVSGDSVQICVSNKADMQNVLEMFASQMPSEFGDKTYKADIPAKAWGLVQNLRKL